MTEVFRGQGVYSRCHYWFVSEWDTGTHVPLALSVAQYCPLCFMRPVFINGLWYQTHSCWLSREETCKTRSTPDWRNHRREREVRLEARCWPDIVLSWYGPASLPADPWGQVQESWACTYGQVLLYHEQVVWLTGIEVRRAGGIPLAGPKRNFMGVT